MVPAALFLIVFTALAEGSDLVNEPVDQGEFCRLERSKILNGVLFATIKLELCTCVGTYVYVLGILANSKLELNLHSALNMQKRFSKALKIFFLLVILWLRFKY